MEFAGNGAKDVSSSGPKMSAPANSTGSGPIQMAGAGDKDTSGTFKPKDPGTKPSGGNVQFAGDGKKDI